MMGFSVERKIRCVERELRQRERVYPRLVAQQRMRQDQADEEVAVLREILEDYQAQAMADPQGDLFGEDGQ